MTSDPKTPRGTAAPADRTAILVQTLLLLAAEGLSVGLALAFLLVKGNVDAFLTTNAISARVRHFMLAMGFGGAALAVGLGSWFAWRVRNQTHTSAAVQHAARRLAPLAVAAFLPLLFRWQVWKDRSLTFLVLVVVAAVILEAALRAAIAAGPFAREVGLWRRASSVAGAARDQWPRLTRSLPLLAVCAGAASYAAYFSYYTCAWHWGVRSGYDLALENNILWNLLHGGQFMKSSPLVGPVGSHFGFHATLFAFVILPFYALAQRPETLLVLQSVLIGGAAIPLYFFARRHLNPALACLISLLYLLYPPIHGPTIFEFHYLPLGTFFLWTTLYLLESRRNRLAIVALIVTLSVREDVAASLAILGAYLIVSGQRPRAGFVVAAVSAAYFVIMKMIIMPRFAGGETFTFIFRDLLPPGENTFGSVIKTVISNPAFTLSTLLEQGKLIYFLQIIAPLAFIPLRRPLSALFVVPGFLFTLLSTGYSPTVSIHFQYTAHWTTFMFVALVLVLEKMDPPRRRAAVGALVLALLACSYQYGSILQTNTSYGGPIHYKFGINDEDRERRRSLDAVLAYLPPSAKVSSSGFTVPQVSSRADDYSMTIGVFDAEYLLFPSERGDFIVNERQTVTDLLTNGTFGVVKVDPPFALARRGHPTTDNAALIARWK